jgi:HPt (histidine-containing phosphotransfer) domain-containing protein
MPEMDGLEATRRIRKLDGPRGRVPIVALTAHAFTEQVEACRSAGMDGHVSKPFTKATLLAAVAAVSAGRAHNESDRPVSVLAVPDIAMIGAELVVFDRNAFDSVPHYIPPKMVATHIKTITERGEALLLELHHGNDLTHAGDELADAAHALAGSAGMLGFERVATLGRRFEHALRSGAADAPALAGALGAAIKATLQTIAHLRAAGSTKANGVKSGGKPSRPHQQRASGSNAGPAAKRTERRLPVEQRVKPPSGTA